MQKGRKGKEKKYDRASENKEGRGIHIHIILDDNWEVVDRQNRGRKGER